MSEKVVLKRQVYLSVEQYNTLKSTGSVTVDGKTIEFSENDEYITPDTTGADITAVRQELLGEIQKKADTSYVDEEVSGVGGTQWYRYQVLFGGVNDKGETLPQYILYFWSTRDLNFSNDWADTYNFFEIYFEGGQQDAYFFSDNCVIRSSNSIILSKVDNTTKGEWTKDPQHFYDNCGFCYLDIEEKTINEIFFSKILFTCNLYRVIKTKM